MKLYTSKVLAQWLNITERRVRQLRDEGVIREEAPGLYNLRQSVISYIAYLKHGSSELNDERTKLTAEKRKAAELDNAMRYGNIHTTEDIEKALKTLCLNTRSRFLALPAKLSPTLATMGGNQAQIFDTLKGAINEALEELSDYKNAFKTNGEEEDEDS
jgi:phage terminase Nu1 subunit (DNA packaging protein)